MDDVETFVGVTGEKGEWLRLGGEEIEEWKVVDENQCAAVSKNDNVENAPFHASEEVEKVEENEENSC